jgi:hypothetical protein
MRLSVSMAAALLSCETALVIITRGDPSTPASIHARSGRPPGHIKRDRGRDIMFPSSGLML